jgi:hypothetical protein
MVGSRRTWLWAVTFAAIHVAIAAITCSHPIFFGAVGPYAITAHHDLFFGYAEKAMEGQVPYRDFLVEYPLLGFVVFLVPRLITSSPSWYGVWFGIQLLLFNSVAVALVAKYVEAVEGPQAVLKRLIWYTAFFVALCPLAMGPFDLAPMALAFSAAYWLASGREGLGGAVAGLGVVMKIFPGVVALPSVVKFVTKPDRATFRGLLIFGITTLIGVGCWFALGGRGVLNSIRYHAERGLEVESLYAGLVYLYGDLTGRKVTSGFDHGASHVDAAWGSRVVPFVFPIQALSLLYVAWRFWKSGMRDSLRYSGAAVLAFIATGKVLSPQFMIWMIPFIACFAGKRELRARLVFLACAAMSSMSFPGGVFLFVTNGYLWAELFMNARNGLLLYLLYLLTHDD